MDSHTAFAKTLEENGVSTFGSDDWVTNPIKKNVSPAKTTSLRNAEKSTKCRKRSPTSGALSTSEPQNKARKEIEQSITPSTESPELAFDETGFYPVKDGDVLERRYELQELLGNGVYGTVYFADDRHTDNFVAVKIGRSGESYNIGSNLEVGFMKTAKNLSRTMSSTDGSDNIVTLLDDFNLRGPRGLHVVMVMELLGSDLFTILTSSNQNLLPLHRVKSFSKNILEGLHFLHKKCKIMHLDLKPDNLFVSVDPDNMDLSDPNCLSRLKIGDFGLSAKTSDIVKRTVQASQYRAPVSFLKVQITQAADLWSVGCIIYEMATRTMMFPQSGEEHCDEIWHLCRISELLGPVRMRYFERNELNAEIFEEVFGNETVFIEKPLRNKFISPGEIMRDHPMEDYEAEGLHELLRGLLSISPKQRLSAKGALKQSFFIMGCLE